MRLRFRWRSAQGMRGRANIDAPYQFEFEQRHPHRAPSLRRLAQFVEFSSNGDSRLSAEGPNRLLKKGLVLL
jgi:hypothetical protein